MAAASSAPEQTSVRCRIGGSEGVVVPAIYPGTPRRAAPALASVRYNTLLGPSDGGAFTTAVEDRTSVPLAGTPLAGLPSEAGWSDPELHVDCMVPSQLVDAIVPRTQRPSQAVATDPQTVAIEAARRLDGAQIEISTNGDDFSTSQVRVRRPAVPVVNRISPAFLEPSGGQSVLIEGSGFEPVLTLACRFDFSGALDGGASSRRGLGMPFRGAAGVNTSVLVAASWLSATQLRCHAPPAADGPMSVAIVEVSNDGGATFSQSGRSVTYREVPEVHAVRPQAGPYHGGVVVTVFGRGFAAAQGFGSGSAGETIVPNQNARRPMLSCRFGSVEVPALRIVSDSSLQCIAPSQPAGAVQVPVDVSVDGQTFSRSGIHFRYREPAFVTSLLPAKGPATGGTAVLVLGEGFENSSPAYEESGLPMTDGIVLGMPEPLSGGTLQNVVTEASLVTDPLRVGPGMAWGTRDLADNDVFASSLRSRGNLLCRFGDVNGATVPARYVSEHAVECVAPSVELHPSSDGLQDETTREVVVQVSMDGGLSWADSGSVFTFEPEVVLESLEPASGPAGMGGTLVTLRGRGFTNTAMLGCRFGQQDVQGRFIDESTIVCIAPPLGLGAVQVRVTLNGVDFSPALPQAVERRSFGGAVGRRAVDELASLGIGAFEAWPRGGESIAWDADATEIDLVAAHRLALAFPETIDGRQPPSEWVDLLASAPSTAPVAPLFHYLPLPTVSTVSPSQSLWSGSLPIYVRGAGFVNTTGLACTFGPTSVKAVFVSPTLLICPAPQRSSAQRFPAQTVSVRVTLNGRDFSQTSAAFQYLGFVPPGYYAMGYQLLRAPNGTYVQRYGAHNFTLAEPGYFQPRAGMTAQLPCPVGYYCPDFGLSAPVLCEPGYVCDKLGLVQPRTPCPRGHFCPAGTKSDDPQDFLGVEYRPLSVDLEEMAARGSLLDNETVLDREGRRTFLEELDDWRMSVLGYNRETVEDPAWDEWSLNREFGLASFNAGPRGWEPLPRPYPEEGRELLEDPHPGFDRTPRRDDRHIHAERPHPCPLGDYCRTGVASNVSIPKNFSTPQRCFDGFFCSRGSETPEGVGPCPTGFYCPTETEAFICPPGHYCPGTANVRPLRCYPGTFNPNREQSSCSLCPPGHICPEFNMTVPVICPAGFICAEFGLPEPVVQCPPGYYCPAGVLTFDLAASVAEDPFAAPFDGDYDETLDAAILSIDDGITRTVSRRLAALRLEELDEERAVAEAEMQAKDNAEQLGSGQAAALEMLQQAGGAVKQAWEGRRMARQVAMLELAHDAGLAAGLPVSALREKAGAGFGGALRAEHLEATSAEARRRLIRAVGSEEDKATTPARASHAARRLIASAARAAGSASTAADSPLPTRLDVPPEAIAGYEDARRRLGIQDDGQFDNAPLPTAEDITQTRQAVVQYLEEIIGPDFPSRAQFEASPIKPVACLPGTFCFGGVASNVTLDWLPQNPSGASAPQTCTEGSYCRFGAGSPAGSGACFPGHFCPPGSVFPTQAPLGTFASGSGNVAPTLCFPGTYAALLSTSECRPCPAGFTCAGYGTYIPTICPAGTYRTLADSISCRLCPEGTFSARTGLTSILDCEPCPAGRVCGQERMTNLTQSSPCPDGHVCGDGTTKAKQFDHPCPAGVYCDEQTRPANQLDSACEPGSYCLRGTKAYLRNRNKCSVGYYCPAGTTDSFPTETMCPFGTTSKSGVSRITDCELQPVRVCDKDPDRIYYPRFSYTFNGEEVVFDDGENEIEVLRHINPVNESASDAYWRNDSTPVTRICPSIVTPVDLGIPDGATGDVDVSEIENDPGTSLDLVVIGRNFDPETPLFCRFQMDVTAGSALDGVVQGTDSLSADGTLRPVTFTRGTVHSEFRLTCPLPWHTGIPAGDAWQAALDAGTAGVPDSITLNVTVLQLAGKSVGDPAQLVVSPNRLGLTNAEYQSQQLDQCGARLAGEEEPLPDDPLNRWFEVRGLSVAQMQFDFAHLPVELTYDEHFRIAITVVPSICTDEKCDEERIRISNTPENEALLETTPCKQPLALSTWFLDRSVEKRRVLNVSVVAMEDVRMNVQLHMMYGLYLSVAPQLINTTTVRISSPERARMIYGVDQPTTRVLPEWLTSQEQRRFVEYTFAAIYRREYLEEISVPLNLPPRFEGLERGRVLPIFNVSEETSEAEVPWVRDPTEDVRPGPEYWEPPLGNLAQQIEKYRETYHEAFQAGDGLQYTFTKLTIPYLPYISNCKGYDSYIPIFHLLESDQCELPVEGTAPDKLSHFTSDYRQGFPQFPHPDDIEVVEWTDFFQSPVADECYRVLQCKYEETLPTRDVNPRWFEVASDTELFQLLRRPMTLEEIQDGGRKLDDVLNDEGLDTFIPVLVDRSDADLIRGECTRLCFPRAVDLELKYYQQTRNIKRIISATLYLRDFDRQATSTEYEFSVLFHPLNYLDLVIAFAFEELTFVVLFIVVGALTLLASILFWAVHRVFARSPIPLRYRFFVKLVIPPAFAGILLGLIPVAIIVGGLHLLIRGDQHFNPDADIEDRWLLDNLYGHYIEAEVDTRLIPTYRRGRLGFGFLVMAGFLLVLSSYIFVPKLISKRERRIEQSDDVVLGRDSTWTPTMWKRSLHVIVSVMYALFLVGIVEFSFWDNYGTYIWYVIVALKFVAIFTDLIIGNFMKEALLVAPLGAAMGIVQTLITLGSEDFADFLLAYSIEFGLMLLERTYIGPLIDFLIDFISETTATVMDWVRGQIRAFRRATLEEELLAEEQRARRMVKNREVEIPVEGQNTVEPLLDAFAGYSMDTLALYYSPVIIFMFIFFRQEMEIPDLYSIREQDMRYYLWFALIVGAF